MTTETAGRILNFSILGHVRRVPPAEPVHGLRARRGLSARARHVLSVPPEAVPARVRPLECRARAARAAAPA